MRACVSVDTSLMTTRVELNPAEMGIIGTISALFSGILSINAGAASWYEHTGTAIGSFGAPFIIAEWAKFVATVHKIATEKEARTKTMYMAATLDFLRAAAATTIVGVGQIAGVTAVALLAKFIILPVLGLGMFFTGFLALANLWAASKCDDNDPRKLIYMNNAKFFAKVFTATTLLGTAAYLHLMLTPSIYTTVGIPVVCFFVLLTVGYLLKTHRKNNKVAVGGSPAPSLHDGTTPTGNGSNTGSASHSPSSNSRTDVNPAPASAAALPPGGQAAPAPAEPVRTVRADSPAPGASGTAATNLNASAEPVGASASGSNEAYRAQTSAAVAAAGAVGALARSRSPSASGQVPATADAALQSSTAPVAAV